MVRIMRVASGLRKGKTLSDIKNSLHRRPVDPSLAPEGTGGRLSYNDRVPAFAPVFFRRIE